MHPIFATADANLWLFALVALGGLVRWLVSSFFKSLGQGPGATPRPPRTTEGATVSEEERARKFMEALGLPASSSPSVSPLPPPPLPRQPAPSLRPATSRRRGQQWPVPPIISPVPDWTTVGRKVSLPKAPDYRAAPELPSLTTTSGSVELAALQTPGYQEFRTKSAEVSAIPETMRYFESGSGEPGQSAQLKAVRALLREPAVARTAMVLREVLGPPPGLQSF